MRCDVHSCAVNSPEHSGSRSLWAVLESWGPSQIRNRGHVIQPAFPWRPLTASRLWRQTSSTHTELAKPVYTLLNLAMCNSNVIKTSRKLTVCSHFGLHQQHNKLPLLCSDCCGDDEQGSRMIRSVTVATSFHFNYNVPSIPLALRPSLLAPPLCQPWGCAALPLSLPRDALGGGMLLSHASHAHSFVWHAAPPDNTFAIKGPR